MQQKVEKPEDIDSFNWFLKTLQEEQVKQEVPGEELAPPKAIIELMRFIKVVNPTVNQLMEFCNTDLKISALTATNILDRLEKDGDIEFEEVRTAGTSTTPAVFDKIVKITKQGLKKLDV